MTIVYPWLGSAEIVGTITNPTWVSITVVSFTPFGTNLDFGYLEVANRIWSHDSAGNVLSSNVYDITVFSTTFVFQGASIEVSDADRLISSMSVFAHGAGGRTGDAILGIALPDNLSVANEYPIAGVPEPSTWLMLLIGFVALSAARRRLTVHPAPLSLARRSL